MGITIFIIFVLAIAGVIVWFYIKNKKESDTKLENPSESVSQPIPVDEVSKEEEPKNPKEETKPVEEEKTKFKDGDILVCKEDKKPFIFKGFLDKFHPNCPVAYCGIDTKDTFAVSSGDGWWTDDEVQFATKEQSDLLFQKMHEAGYEWNPDTKELKEIEQPPVEVPTEEPKKEPEVPEPPVTPEEKPKYDEEFEGYLNKYSNFAKIERDSYTYKYFYELFREAKSQLRIDTCHGLPILLKKENFPTLYEFGDKGDAKKAQDTLIGWLFSLQLAELKPYYRTDIFKLGYEMGGYNKYSNIYGYKFEYDPNIMRILAGAIYPSVKGYCKPITETMCKEVEGTMYGKTLKQLYTDEKRDNVSSSAFFTDFRVFMPTAPAPYSPAYSKRSDRTYPNEPRDEYDNLKIDRQIHEMIIEAYNLSQSEHYQETVQAIADKEAEAKHMFGKNRQTKNYQFHPVFGEDTIGVELSDEGTLADFAYLVFRTGSASRGIMQSATINPVQYGRLRPGCSWNQEAKKNSKTDDRRNILTNFEIEDGDGSPTGYYDANGNWVYMNGIHNPKEFEEYQKNTLYANSYPSGHSSGIFCVAMLLMELIPNKADLILKAANQYAVNRTIARYHWTSDTINGRVLGSATNAICHATSDYSTLLKIAKKEIK